MKTLELGQHRKARVWLHSLPDAVYTSFRSVTREVVAERACSSAGDVFGAVEVFVPLGARWLYGLLGGHWQPEATDHVVISVNVVGSAHERHFTDSLAKLDEVRVGLP